MTLNAPDLPASTARIEQASLNAWPALHQVLHDGWLLRFCGGFTKRANSVSIVSTGERSLDARIAFCEALYEQHGQATVFRLSSACPELGLDAVLATRGYALLDVTDVLTADARTMGLLHPPQALLHPPQALLHTPQALPHTPQALPRQVWLAHYARLSGSPTSATRLHELLLAGIRLPCLYAVVESAGAVVACGLAVCEADMVGLFDIVTDVQHRAQGHAQRLTAAMVAWGAAQGARTAYLQVLAANAPAQRLYHRLGFSRQYRYWYRTGPVHPDSPQVLR